MFPNHVLRQVTGPDFSGWKIPPERVGLDDFEQTTREGVVYRPHIGESIWISPDGLSVEASQTISRFAELAKAARLVEGSEGADGLTGLDDSFEALCVLLVGILAAWDITTNARMPYEQPTTVAAIKALPTPLMMHIMNAVQGGETEGNARAGEAGLQGGSSTTATSQPTPAAS